MSSMKTNTGIEENGRVEIAQYLGDVLSDTFALYVKTQAFHWNVTGHFFDALHKMFQVQYEDLFEASDEVAERIRALGVYAPGSMQEFSKRSIIKEEMGVPSWSNMVRQLLEGNEHILQNLRKVVPLAEKYSDYATVDLIVRRVQAHEKSAWMLRSMAEH